MKIRSLSASHLSRYILATLITGCNSSPMTQAQSDPDRIQPYAANPRYWQYKGQPVLLLATLAEQSKTVCSKYPISKPISTCCNQSAATTCAIP